VHNIRDLLQNLGGAIAVEMGSEFQPDNLVLIAIVSEGALPSLTSTIVDDPTYKRIFIEHHEGYKFYFGLPHTHDTLRPPASAESEPTRRHGSQNGTIRPNNSEADAGSPSSEIDASLDHMTSLASPIGPEGGNTSDGDAEFALRRHAQSSESQSTANASPTKPPPLPKAEGRERKATLPLPLPSPSQAEVAPSSAPAISVADNELLP
jgi:hypothetical protein